ncbi:kazal-type serine proteinase inhibitor 1 [Elysia marginata]|uniref:Kazal-type serine proteinase inhibitor 1 n=1 Tax=Elysia marginata TaxID=1093978 RepID=A0AAV4HZJ0_9GAST|nr:kazal-type serine proteinase inhibitor 1 [Elysia marginata]
MGQAAWRSGTGPTEKWDRPQGEVGHASGESGMALGRDRTDEGEVCDFAKAHCADPDIHIRYYGECADTDKPDPICAELLATTCPTGNNPVCASDGITYDGFCQYQLAECKDPDLTLVRLGACPTEPPSTTVSLFDLICQVILTEQCPSGQPQVCGSDGVTYDSG